MTHTNATEQLPTLERPLPIALSRLEGRLGKTRVEPSRGRLLSQLLTAVLVLALGAVSSRAQSAGGTLQGSISAGGPDGQPFNIPGVSLTLSSTARGSTPLEGFSDERGEYKFVDVPPGIYKLAASLQGFQTLAKSVTIPPGGTVVENVRLELATLHEEVTVRADNSDTVQAKEAAPAEELKQTTLQSVPLAKEKFQTALPLIPGVVRGPDGLLNVKGSRASQSGLTVNSANVTDPVTGEFAINLPIEAIRSVQVLTNPYAPEYGKFTGAVTSIETRTGTDAWKVQFQDFFPRLRRRGGKTRGFESFTPRLAFGGPLTKSNLKLFQSLEYNFTQTKVESLPPLRSDTKLESFDSFTQLDWDIDPSNHLTTTFSLFPQKLAFVGLNTFNSQDVTPNFSQRGFFWAVNERRVLSSSSVLESYFSIKQFDANVFPSTGGELMTFAPDVNSGSFFNRQDRNSRRYEALEAYTFTPARFAGSHLMKVGAGFSYNTFDGRNESSPVRIVRADGTRSQQIEFAGDTTLHRNKSEVLAYFQDKWSMGGRLTLEYGVRYDRDTISDENNLAPRLGFAVQPFGDGRTVVRGGVGLFYDKINLNVATFGQLQDRVLRRFAADGKRTIGVPRRQRLVLEQGALRAPRSVNWNLEFDREWLKHLVVRVGYQQREGRREYILDPVEDPTRGSMLGLSSTGRSRYREFQVTTRYAFRTTDSFVASYVRSRALGDLNDFNSFFGNFENPIIRPNERSLLPWDAPNRFLFWGTFTPGYGISLAPVLEVRNGFPRSILDEDRNFIGPRNRAGRFPTFGSLDLQVTKSIPLPLFGKGHRARVGLKVFNITNHFNPRDFQGNVASSGFGEFFNGVSRSFRGKFVLEF